MFYLVVGFSWLVLSFLSVVRRLLPGGLVIYGRSIPVFHTTTLAATHKAQRCVSPSQRDVRSLLHRNRSTTAVVARSSMLQVRWRSWKTIIIFRAQDHQARDLAPCRGFYRGARVNTLFPTPGDPENTVRSVMCVLL
uniref:Putative secreted protein n=1 Tax=Anopheles darlingi TaxID=43151 RepID=A0A2M4D1Z4_ANODA